MLGVEPVPEFGKQLPGLLLLKWLHLIPVDQSLQYV